MILPFTSGLLTSVFLKNNFGIYIVRFHEETNIHITSTFHKRFFVVENGSSDVQTKKIGSFKNSLKGSLGTKNKNNSSLEPLFLRAYILICTPRYLS